MVSSSQKHIVILTVCILPDLLQSPVFPSAVRARHAVLTLGGVALRAKSRIIEDFVNLFWSFVKKTSESAQGHPTMPLEQRKSSGMLKNSWSGFWSDWSNFMAGRFDSLDFGVRATRNISQMSHQNENIDLKTILSYMKPSINDSPIRILSVGF